GNIEAVFVVKTPADIRESDDFVAGLLHQAGGHGADIAEALNDDPRALLLQAQLSHRFVYADHDAAAGRFAAAARAAEFNGLARADGSGGLPHVHRVGVHDPGHALLASASPRRGYVALWS